MEQEMVPAGSCDLEGAARQMLASHLGHVPDRLRPHPRGSLSGSSAMEPCAEDLDRLGQTRDTMSSRPWNRRHVSSRVTSHDTWEPGAGGEHARSQRGRPGTNGAVEGKLSDDNCTTGGRYLPGGGQDSERYRKVVVGARLGEIGRRQVHGHGAVGELDA
jgi:hypothetical protein